MASAPPPPANVSIEGAVSADTTLKWTRPPASQAPNLAGYKVHWRLTTEPQWTPGVYVGAVAQHTLKNVVIDNYFFGVSAIAKDGEESQIGRAHVCTPVPNAHLVSRLLLAKTTTTETTQSTVPIHKPEPPAPKN